MSSKQLRMYVCGPTVYDHSHIGHARTYMTVDLIHRTMKYLGSDTFLVMNITDIDDKIIQKAAETNTHWREVAKTYENSFFESMHKLKILYPHVIIRVSEVIREILEYIQVLIDKGFAYPTKDGSIYFDSEKYKEAGYEYVSGTTQEIDKELFPPEISEISENVENGLRNTKKGSKDFALWKGRKSSEIGFPANFTFENRVVSCYGRPGWHIECSAMINETLGDSFDIHFGGIDLKFPHHYNENAQANAYHHPKCLNQKWCGEFKHVGHLCIDGLKMSKSLKNFTTIDEILKYTSPNVLRWLFMKFKWTEQMNFSDETLKEAKLIDEQVLQLINKVQNFPFERKNIKFNSKEKDFESSVSISEKPLETFEFDLFVQNILEFIKNFNIYLSKDYPNESICRWKLNSLESILQHLGFDYTQNKSNIETKVWMNYIVQERTLIRQMTRLSEISKDKLFDLLDKQRKYLSEQNIKLQDTKDSSLWFIQ